MIVGSRANVLVAADPDQAGMLTEWLHAAGFDAIALDEFDAVTQPSVVATLLRWPFEVDIETLPRPIILLYEPGAELQPVVGAVAQVIEVPDSKDVRSLLAWSAKMSGVLRELADSRQKQIDIFAPVTLPPEPESVPSRSTRRAAPSLLALGISTGGPSSLRVLFDGLSAAREPLPPLVIVQHIPPAYVEDLAQRLRDQSGYDVRCCGDLERLQEGVAYIAPGNHHVRVTQRGDHLYAVWDDRAPIRGHCPSVEVLFESCTKLDVSGIAIIMTGMGRDGSACMKALRDKGWATIGQDEATCTIYGMPRAAKEAGAVARELPLDQIAPWLVASCRRHAPSI
ncbi:MAG: chemotaxis response regulator CheB [Neolewinella sp.]|jgi:chemotaxis response regulator CheB